MSVRVCALESIAQKCVIVPVYVYVCVCVCVYVCMFVCFSVFVCCTRHPSALQLQNDIDSSHRAYLCVCVCVCINIRLCRFIKCIHVYLCVCVMSCE